MMFGLVPLAVLGGIAFLVWTSIRSSIDGTSTEPVDVARSAAISVGLLLSMLAVSVGLIDLLQAAGGSERLAGSNTDVARGLSLLIVGGPTFGLLTRLTATRRRERIGGGDSQPLRGWSTYLVAALTISLVGVLVSVGQILAENYDFEEPVDSDIVAQLVGWFTIWVAHWFLLRPRFGVRGAVHLGAGTIAGLAWLVTGVVGFTNAVLSDAYDALFRDTLADSRSLLVWVWTALVGAAVWLWHWRSLNRDQSVEGATRGGPTWYVTVIVFAILPSLITLLVFVGGSIAGIAIWFLGSTDSDAVEYFSAVPPILTAGLVALGVWAYHRWVVRNGPAMLRSEASRFYDYAVAAIGLVGVVTGTALIVNLLILSTTATNAIAERFEADNRLILAVVVAGLSAAVWWQVWSVIEGHRRTAVVAESDSVSRKLYLTVAAGVGALVLAVSLTWILFTGLRDLFDGELGRSTLTDLTGPIGWSVAVLGAVWFHVGVWRSDRAILEAHRPVPAPLPPPPPPPAPLAPPAPASSSALEPLTPQTPAPAPSAPAASAVQMRWATPADHGELYTLQRAAFVDEGLAYDTPRTPALLDTFQDFTARMTQSQTLVARHGTRIVGAVSVREYRDDIPDIERLMVAPDLHRSGIATALLDAVEGWLRSEGHESVQLVVGEIAQGPRRLYDSRGFELIERLQEPDGPALLTVRKTLA